MKSYFQSFTEFKASGGSIKTTTITPQQLLPALVAHIQRMDKQFTLHVNGRLPKSIDELLQEAFEQSHLQQPFYTQHCEHRSYRYRNVSKNRIKIDFTIRYRMNREQEKWMHTQIEQTLVKLIQPQMTNLEKILIVHDYIARTYDYELHTEGSPYAVYTFMKEKRGVCMAYALLFEKMMEHLDIPCYYVIGKADGEGNSGHAWNMVQLDGQWYHLDVTWDDIGSKSTAWQIRYRYFLLTDEQMKKDHQWNLADYPPCTSDRFQILHNLYDVCIAKNTLYFPHPKNALLYEINLASEPFKAKKRLDTRVQFIAYQDESLFFSNYSVKGYLYRTDLVTGELHELRAAQVTAIVKTEAGLEITFRDQSTEVIEKANVLKSNEPIDTVHENAIQKVSSMNRLGVPLLGFDGSWMATYEQTDEMKALLFTSADGLELAIDDLYKQLTIDIYIDKGFHVRITSARRDVNLKSAAQLKIPKSLLPDHFEQLSERLPSGKLIAAEYVMESDFMYVNIMKSTQFKF